jgi:hypothetical protein
MKVQIGDDKRRATAMMAVARLAWRVLGETWLAFRAISYIPAKVPWPTEPLWQSEVVFELCAHMTMKSERAWITQAVGLLAFGSESMRSQSDAAVSSQLPEASTARTACPPCDTSDDQKGREDGTDSKPMYDETSLQGSSGGTGTDTQPCGSVLLPLKKQTDVDLLRLLGAVQPSSKEAL